MSNKKQTRTSERAFTIIEVVLVLAIAGLIFLMVFIALPALQRSQRNTERKRQVDVVYTGIIEYQKNNKNNPPCRNFGNNWGCEYDVDYIPRYVDDDCEFDYEEMGIYYYQGCDAQFTDPDGTVYSILVYADTTRHGLRFSTAHEDDEENHISKEVKEKITNPLLNSITTTGSILDSAKYFGYGRQASAEDIYDHAMVLAFGYACSVTEGKALLTFKPNDFIVALRLEGGGMYCHGSSTGEDNYGEYDIIPDWGGYYGEPK